MANENFEFIYDKITTILPPYKNNEANEDLVEKFGVYKKDYENFENTEFTKDEFYDLNSSNFSNYFKTQCWDTCLCNDLLPGIDILVFAVACKTTSRNAVLLLQKSLGVSETGTADTTITNLMRTDDGVVKTNMLFDYLNEIESLFPADDFEMLKSQALFLI